MPHGVVCAALLPHVMAANIAALRSHSPENPVLDRYDWIGHVIGRFSGDDVVTAVADLAAPLHTPRLGEFGVAEQHVPEMVALARKTSSMRYNPVELSDEALAGALRAAL